MGCFVVGKHEDLDEHVTSAVAEGTEPAHRVLLLVVGVPGLGPDEGDDNLGNVDAAEGLANGDII